MSNFLRTKRSRGRQANRPDRLSEFIPKVSRLVALSLKSYFLIIIPLLLVTACSSVDQQSAIQTGLSWSRMAPLPGNVSDLEVDARGSSFSREIIIRFSADEETIQRWIDVSDGPKHSEMITKGDRVIYEIRPGGGAQYAQLTVDWETLTVLIITYWS